MPFTIAGGRLFLYCKNEQQKQNHKADYVFHYLAPFRGTTCRPLDGLSIARFANYVNSVFTGVLEKV